jgi:hypothetical protein
MKLHSNFIVNVTVLSGAILFVAKLPALAAPTATNAIVRSVFILPASMSEGRDPFFPNSLRPYANANPVPARGADLTSLTINGFSGQADHRLVIINNHTFAVGDEEDVITSQGRIHVRCLEIKDNSVLIEAEGHRQELTYKANQ